MLTQSLPHANKRYAEVPFAGAELTGLRAALDTLATIVARPADAAEEPVRGSFDSARRDVIAALKAWIRPDKKHVVWSDIRDVLSRVIEGGWLELPLAEEQPAIIEDASYRSVSELAASILQGPAWRHRHVAALSEVPDLWWGVYASWVFAGPQGFSRVGDAEVFAQHYLMRLRDLSSWLERSPGSAAVRSAAQAYLKSSNTIPLYFSEGSLREHAELRASLLRRLVAAREIDPGFYPYARDGRRLRVGFVNRHFGPQTETYTTLPSFEQLDPERFEVMLFSLRSGNTPLETYARSRAASYQVLPGDLDGQLATLRAAGLDVVVFGTNVTAVVNEVTRLALHRVAPLQVLNNSSCITSGFPMIDLYVSGDLTEIPEASDHFTERLGLLPGPTHAFNYEADRQAPTQTWTKTALGIPEDAIVFGSAANYYKIIPEMREAWAKLLAVVPGSRLLLHPFNPNWSSDYPIKQFCAEFEQVLTRHGVSHDRLVVSSMKFPSRSDVSALMSVADVYLDTAPFGGVNSLIDPLEQGVPVITWEGKTMRARMGSALLRTLGLEQWIATDETSYLVLATQLATDAAQRQTISDAIKLAMDRAPIFLDTLAASDAFGDLIETAYDELVVAGTDAFRANRQPLRTTRTTPLTRDARRTYGNELLRQGRQDRALAYLMAALQQDDGTAGLWIDVARALHANGRNQDALQALEAGLRLDETYIPGWEMMVELADLAGNEDLATQARGVIEQLKPKAKPNVSGVLGKLRANKS